MMANAIESMVYIRDMPWHGIGKRVKKSIAIKKVLEESGIDRHFLPKDREAFQVVEDIMNSVGKQFIEAVGLLKGGRQIFIIGKIEGCTVLGDQVDLFLIFTHSHFESTTVRVSLMPIRMVCNNPLTPTLYRSTRQWDCSHTSSKNDEIADARETLKRANQYMKEFQDYAKRMVDTVLYDDDIVDFMDKLFPTPEDPSPLIIKNIDWKKQTLYNIYTAVEDIAKFEGTAWGMYNAVSDLATHVHPKKEKTTWRENLFTKTVNGRPLINKAQEIFGKF